MGEHQIVATIIAPISNPVLGKSQLDLAQKALLNADCAVGSVETLRDGVAYDLFFAAPEGVSLKAIIDVLLTALKAYPVDVIVQMRAKREKKLFLADMDSTMIGQECIDELADFVGLKTEVSAITERAMRGEIAFEPALKQRVALLKGLSTSIVDEILAKRITYTAGGETLVKTMKARGGYTCLVSGGFTLFTEKVAAKIGFDLNRANILKTEGDKLTGDVMMPILGKEAKRETLLEMRAKLQLTPDQVVAIGDGANDLAMLEEAGLGVAYRAKPAVAAAAHAKIEHTDLTSLLYAQGIKFSAFA